MSNLPLIVEIEKMHEDVVVPEYKHDGDAGMDIRAYLPNKERISIFPGARALIPTGIKVSIPEGFEIQVRPRSGLAIKNGITVLNTPGTIDSGYRGEIGVVLQNATSDVEGAFCVEHGDRVAQIVLCPVNKVQWEVVNELSGSTRSEGGFGSTGEK